MTGIAVGSLPVRRFWCRVLGHRFWWYRPGGGRDDISPRLCCVPCGLDVKESEYRLGWKDAVE
jgi:hypothetical protein